MTSQNSQKDLHETMSNKLGHGASCNNEIVFNRKEIEELGIEKGIDTRQNSSCNESDFDKDNDEEDLYWDINEEHASVECVNMSEFKDLLQVNLLVTSLNNCHTQVNPGRSTTCARVHDVNQKYLHLYPDIGDTKNRKCSVKFSNNPEIILEPENLAKELHEARTSDFKQRQADRERQERLLAPILTRTHREKMFRKIYGEGL